MEPETPSCRTESEPVHPSAASRLRAAACTVLAGVVLAAGATTPATAAPAEPASTGLAARVAQLNRDITRVSDELAAGAVAYEKAADALARTTQAQFAARSDAEARTADADASRSSLDGLARAAYKGGIPPIVTALLSGDPRTVGDLAYVQRSVNRVGVDRREAARAAYLASAGTGKTLQQSDATRRRALVQRQALDAQLKALTDKADRLTAQLAATADQLFRARTDEAARAAAASRAESLREAGRRSAELLAAARAAGAQIAAQGGASTGGGAGCAPPSPYGEANGFLSDVGLCPLEVGGGHRLRTDASQAFNLMNRAHLASMGLPICVTDSYRSYAEQVDVFKRKPSLAATPGRSQHGWGLAVDLCGGVQSFGSIEHEWMRANAGSFGFVHPAWAQRGGSKPEAWHWEYVGG